MSTLIIKGELKTFSGLTGKKQQDYIATANKKQAEIESNIDKHFVNNPYAANIIKEQLRELAAKTAIDYVVESKAKADDNLAYCAKSITYGNAELLVQSLDAQDIAEIGKKVLDKRQENLDKTDKEIAPSEFMQYVRGYAKHWNKRTLDENECCGIVTTVDLEQSDIEFLQHLVYEHA